MTDITERITPEMNEKEALGAILDEIMARAESDVAEAIRFCAIPHWFNEEIIAWLRGEGLEPSQRSREILAALTELTFVGPYHEWGWAYHENVRDLLLRRWRERHTGCLILIRSWLRRWWREDGEEFKELSGRAAAYFEQKSIEALTEDECRKYRREQMYHMLVVNQEEGFKLFNELFEKAMNLHQLGECNLLKELAYEQRECLSLNNQRWLEFREGQLAFVSARPAEAERILERLLAKDLPVALGGEVAAYLGLLHRYMREFEKAEMDSLQSVRYYERVIEMLEEVGDGHGMAAAFNSLGSVYRDRGEWERAIEYFERSLAIKEKVGDERGMAAAFNNLGGVYQARGEWERAIDYYERSLAIKGKLSDEYMVARTFNNLGEVYQAKGEWERTIEYYKHSLAIKEKVGDEYGMAFSSNNIARLYQDQGRLEEAVPLFEKSLEMFERIGDKPSADTVRRNLEKAKQELEVKEGQG